MLFTESGRIRLLSENMGYVILSTGIVSRKIIAGIVLSPIPSRNYITKERPSNTSI